MLSLDSSKERFSSKRKSMLMPRSNGSFEILEKIGLHAYKVDLPGQYGVSSPFNVVDLTPHYEENEEILSRGAWRGPSIGALWSPTLKPTATSKHRWSNGSACLGQKLPWTSKQWTGQFTQKLARYGLSFGSKCWGDDWLPCLFSLCLRGWLPVKNVSRILDIIWLVKQQVFSNNVV